MKLVKLNSKTQLINHYLINENWYLVDLPGYGYAKTSKANRKNFNAFSKEYLIKSTQLRCVFLLIDIRIKYQSGYFKFLVPKDRVTSSSARIFALWITVPAFIMVFISLIFFVFLFIFATPKSSGLITLCKRIFCK